MSQPIKDAEFPATFKRSFIHLLTLTLITAVAVWSGQSSSAPEPGSIKWYVEKAKEQGETSITMPAPQALYEEITSLDQALSTYHLAIGTPIASETQILDGRNIYTWYKLRIIESLIPHPNPEVPPGYLPAALLPVKSNEIVIHRAQGTLTVDGVRSTVTDPDSQLLTLHQKYLFFPSPDGSGKFAWLRAGPNAIFVIKPDNKIAPLVDKQSLMQIDVDASTLGSLDSMRKLAKAKAAELAQPK
ncbi:MAG: hypothetical protein JO270_01525 [Acidobacteriaceae bacterium]|nr:hypothetical protein [Acidobacteriaceae bacterium]